MTNAQQIIATTAPKQIITGENMVKGIYGKRQVVVTYSPKTDSFNVWAFTLSGVEFKKEVRENDVLISNLKDVVKGLI